MEQTSISRTVMRRVRVIHAVRPFFSGASLAALLFILALWGIGREVWVARVFENMPSVRDIAAVARFMLAAFEHTHLTVQALSLVALLALVWMMVDAVRTLASVSAPQRFA